MTPLFLSLWQLLFHGSLYTRDGCAALPAVHLSVCHCLTSHLSHLLCLSVFLFVSSWIPFSFFLSHWRISLFFCISLSQPLSLSSFSLCFFLHLFLSSLKLSPFHHFPCYSRFSACLPYCSIVAVAVPLLIHHLLLSTDLFAKNKPLQLRDGEKMPSSLQSVMAEETGTDKLKLQSFKLKKKENPQLEVKQKKSCQRLP